MNFHPGNVNVSDSNWRYKRPDVLAMKHVESTAFSGAVLHRGNEGHNHRIHRREDVIDLIAITNFTGFKD